MLPFATILCVFPKQSKNKNFKAVFGVTSKQSPLQIKKKDRARAI